MIRFVASHDIAERPSFSELFNYLVEFHHHLKPALQGHNTHIHTHTHKKESTSDRRDPDTPYASLVGSCSVLS